MRKSHRQIPPTPNDMIVHISSNTSLNIISNKDGQTKKANKEGAIFQQHYLTIDDDVYIGIDVHKINCHIAIGPNEAIALTFVSLRTMSK